MTLSGRGGKRIGYKITKDGEPIFYIPEENLKEYLKQGYHIVEKVGAGRPALSADEKKHKVNFWLTLKQKEYVKLFVQFINCGKEDLIRDFINSLKSVIIKNESEVQNDKRKN